MTVAAPRDTPDAWFAGFAAGLAQDQQEFDVTLARRRHHLDARPDRPVADHHRPRRTRRDGAARRCAAGRRHLGHRHDRRRRARPCGGTGQAGRPHRPPAPAATFCRSRAWDWRSPASPPPAWMSRTGWCRTSAISAAPATWPPRSMPPLLPLSAAGAAGRPRLAADHPDRRRRLRTVARCPAGPRGRAAADAARDAGMPVTRIGGFRAGPPGVMVRGPDGKPLSLAKRRLEPLLAGKERPQA